MPFHCRRRLTSPSETNNSRTEKNSEIQQNRTPNSRKIQFLVCFYTFGHFSESYIFYIFNGLEFIFLCFVSLFFHLHIFFSSLRSSSLAYHHVVWAIYKQQSEKSKRATEESCQDNASRDETSMNPSSGGIVNSRRRVEEEKITQILDQKRRNGIKCGQLSCLQMKPL